MTRKSISKWQAMVLLIVFGLLIGADFSVINSMPMAIFGAFLIAGIFAIKINFNDARHNSRRN